MLTADGHAVDVVRDGREALRWARTYPYELVILDVVLPGLDGLAVCSRLRASGLSAPILMLTARDSVDDRVNGLDRGADDYLAKPFEVAELRARLRALGGGWGRHVWRAITVGDLVLDPAELRVNAPAGRFG